MARTPLALVVGCSGPRLLPDEKRLFRDLDPLGFILFARNCVDPAQLKGLVGELRECVGRDDAPVLIDQEGGRVQRLRPPHWRDMPKASAFARLATRDMEQAREAAWLAARLIAEELHVAGISVDCAPVLDVPQPDADPVIGDRAFGNSPSMVIQLGLSFCEGLLAGGVLPTIKHIPGHGRARGDSHKTLPLVDATAGELEMVDFAPFRALAHMPWAMTAHVLYRAIDAERPATTSGVVIGEVIRGSIGFDGVLISDDLAMDALSGSLGERAALVIEGGCDLVLYCNTEQSPLSVVEAVALAAGPMSPMAAERVGRANAMLTPPGAFDSGQALDRLGSLLRGVD